MHDVPDTGSSGGAMSRKCAVPFALAALAVGLAVGWGYPRLSAKSPTLTPQDYIDIQNLYGIYTRYTDMGGEGAGEDYASLFTADAEFNSVTGTDALKKMIANYHRRLRTEGWSSRHTYTGLVITPTPQGAKGSVYLLTFNVSAKPPFVDHSGVYEDWLVKTNRGWKWKKRIYRPSESFKPAMRQGMDELFTSR
jgi:hypothetical protein